MLDAQAQRLFRRLAVFIGGCTLEAVEAVCTVLDADPLAVPMLERMASLIDKSLLQQTEQEDGEPRFGMLETIREYGLEALEASGEVNGARRAHATYYRQLAEEVDKALDGTQQDVWLERLVREYDNLRAAMLWLSDTEEAESDREAAMRLSHILSRCASIRRN